MRTCIYQMLNGKVLLKLVVFAVLNNFFFSNKYIIRSIDERLCHPRMGIGLSKIRKSWIGSNLLQSLLLPFDCLRPTR
jgi:hypothetical protein